MREEKVTGQEEEIGEKKHVGQSLLGQVNRSQGTVWALSVLGGPQV